MEQEKEKATIQKRPAEIRTALQKEQERHTG
jgi:hypothetical protein